MRMIIWTPNQAGVFEHLRSGAGDAVVQAYAGTGKTVTLVEGLRYVNPRDYVLLCAFNARIAAELKLRVPENKRHKITTTYANGHGRVVRQFGKLKVESGDVGRQHVRAVLAAYGLSSGKSARSKDDLAEDIAGIAAIVKYCKLRLLVSPDAVREAITESEYVPVLDTFTDDELVARVVLEAMERAATVVTGAIDFDDQVWIPWRLQLPGFENDLVVVDEGQDLSPAQQWLAVSSIRPGGRIVVAGDEHQYLYGFSGADLGLMNRSGATILSLPESFRCPKKVVEEAQKYVPEIQAWGGAREGTVTKTSALFEHARPGDVILSRMNAPLGAIAAGLIERHIPAVIVGRGYDGQMGLFTLIRRFMGSSLGTRKSGAADVPSLVAWTRAHQNEVLALREEQPARAHAIADQLRMLRGFAHGLQTVDQVRQRIAVVFDERNAERSVRLSTVHRFKGLEADRIFWCKDTFTGRDNPDDANNIRYVAVTRSRDTLFLVSGAPWGEDEDDEEERAAWNSLCPVGAEIIPPLPTSASLPPAPASPVLTSGIGIDFKVSFRDLAEDLRRHRGLLSTTTRT